MVLVDENLALEEDGLDGLEVLLVHLEEDDVLFFEFVLDDGAAEEALEVVEELESAVDGVVVVEPLGDDGGETAFEFLDLGSELVEVVVELLAGDVHDVVGDLGELLDGLLELDEDLADGLREGFALGASEFDFFELGELDDGVAEVEDVVRALEEAVEADEEGVGGEFPASLSLGLVLEVGVLELGADVDALLEAFAGLVRFLVVDVAEDDLAVDEAGGLLDDGVADFADEDNEAGRVVVELGAFVDEEDGVHDWDEEFVEFLEIGVVVELFEVVLEGVEVHDVVVGFDAGLLDLLLELGEGVGVGAFGAFEEAEDVFDLDALELFVDGVEVVGLVFPEVEFFEWAWVVALFEDLFWVLLEDVFDLFRPGDDGSFEDVAFVLIGGLVGALEFVGGEWEHGSFFDESEDDVGLCDVAVEFFHQVFRD